MIIHWIIFLAAISFKLWNDTRLKRSGKIVFHFLSAAIDLLIYASIIYLFRFDTLKEDIGQFILMVSARWILFDPIFAKINWGVWDKHGKSDKIDKFLLFISKYIGKFHPLIKLIPLSIGIYLKYF